MADDPISTEGGEVIHENASRAFLMALLCFAGGTVALVSAIGSDFRDRQGQPMPFFRAMLGVAGFSCVAGSLWVARPIWRPKRLVIGPQRLRLLSARGALLGDVPFGMIQEVVWQRQPRSGHLVLLRLVDPQATGWFWEHGPVVSKLLHGQYGCDVMVGEGFRGGNRNLYDRLKITHDAWRQFG